MDQKRLQKKIEDIYGRDAADAQMMRFRRLMDRFAEQFGTRDAHLFRAPGRTEIGGNHTDHQNGQVLAAAIDLDIAAAAASSEAPVIRVCSEGFGWIETDLGRQPEDGETIEERGTAAALVRGAAKEMKKRGYRIGGFSAYVTSNIPQGAGLSSSAAFEVVICEILNGLFNGGAIPPEEIAQISQVAESVYYGKPCGLMDQMICSVGGLCRIDFSDPAAPAIEQVEADFRNMGYSICITNTHGSHAEFTEDYVAVQRDLAKAAGVFGQPVLKGISSENVIEHAAEIRKTGGDRAFLRALHVTSENDRVIDETNALKEGNMSAFLDLVKDSGNSSYKLLQNVHVDRMPEKQELAVALAVSEAVLKHAAKSACRVHGGGFAGTIQAFVDERDAKPYQAAMDALFGKGSCTIIRICQAGGTQIL